jgi:membrane-bound lytic murein transglycosylase B
MIVWFRLVLSPLPFVLAFLCAGCAASSPVERSFPIDNMNTAYTTQDIQAPENPSPENFNSFLDMLYMRALREGISQETWQKSRPFMQYNPKLIALDRKQSEGTKSFEAYQKGVLTPEKIQKGLSLKAQYHSFFEQVEGQTGVPAEAILALWGMESQFGQNMGKTPLLESLATLGHDARRRTYFQSELMNALRIIQAGHITPEKMKGSWAGAMGQCQFMPKSFLTYAVDGDNDGNKDIWNNPYDVIASIASYLKTEGWKPHQPIALKVTLPEGFYENDPAFRTVSEWQRLGIIPEDNGQDFQNLSAGLVIPPRSSDPRKAYLVFSNYRVIMHWNKSTLFALTVGDFMRSLE